MNELEETMRERLKKNQFMSYNHIELEHVEPDYAVFRLDIRPESRKRKIPRWPADADPGL